MRRALPPAPPPAQPRFAPSSPIPSLECSKKGRKPHKTGKKRSCLLHWRSMEPAPDDVSELESRQEPRLVRALEMVAPGTAVREGIEHILHAHTGALICIGDSDELSFLYSGGVKLEVDYTPAMLYQLAKMDGAITLSENATKIQ